MIKPSTKCQIKKKINYPRNMILYFKLPKEILSHPKLDSIGIIILSYKRLFHLCTGWLRFKNCKGCASYKYRIAGIQMEKKKKNQLIINPVKFWLNSDLRLIRVSFISPLFVVQRLFIRLRRIAAIAIAFTKV